MSLVCRPRLAAMLFPDVNVLICAHREDAPEHDRYAAWLRALTEAHERFAVSEMVLASVIRIVTNPKIFDPPSPMDAAVGFCQSLVDWPRCDGCSEPAPLGHLHGARRRYPRPARRRCVSRCVG